MNMRKLSQKQVERQLETWKKKDRKMYDEIMQLAEEQGIALKSGKLSKSKRKQKAVEKFIEQYQNRYGSYTAHYKKMRETVKKFREKEAERGRKSSKKTIKEEYEDIFRYGELVAEVFNTIQPSEDAYEIYMVANTMDINDAIKFLEEVLGYVDVTDEDGDVFTADFDFDEI